MMSHKLCSFLITTLVYSFCTINTIPRVSAEHGTLIVIVPTKDGVVVCGDKRLHAEETGQDFDTETKVRQLDSSTLYVTAGLLYRRRRDEFSIAYSYNFNSFDIYKIVDEWYKSNSMFDIFGSRSLASNEFSLSYILDPWKSLEQRLESQLLFSKPLTFASTSRQDFLVVLVLRVRNNQILIRGIQSNNEAFSYNKMQSGELLGVDLSKASPIVIGTPDVYSELQHGTNKTFDKLRSDPYVKPFLADFRNRDKVSVNEALAFETTLIASTNELGPAINKNIHVSKTCDCALLDFKEGFKVISSEVYPPPKLEAPKANQPSLQKKEKT